jgi:fructosamine-3-kinase
VILPAGIRTGVEVALSGPSPRRIIAVQPIGGGCISPAARLDLDDGTHAFLKWADRDGVPDGFFDEERRSLRALEATGCIRTPAVLSTDDEWLLLEWLTPGHASPPTWTRLGRDLAAMHRTRGATFGWHADNWIGSLPQRNRTHDSWPDFWREERLLPQWTRARAAGHFAAGDETAFDRLSSRLEELLTPGNADGPSLLHGDLWGGNVHVMAGGDAALIDPSSAHGHREVDLAMAALFGGFKRAFFAAYEEAWPLAPGWPARRYAYQLYYLLVHVNLFGPSYVPGARSAIRLAAKGLPTGSG